MRTAAEGAQRLQRRVGHAARRRWWAPTAASAPPTPRSSRTRSTASTRPSAPAGACAPDLRRTMSEAPGRRPIVPFLRLPADGEPYLAGQRCTACGAVFLGRRLACGRCTARGPFEEIRLSRTGKLWVYSIVHQSSPGVPVPYVAAIVDLPEGVSVRCSLIDVPPDPAALSFGMPVEMTTGVSQQDREGNDVVAFYFRPVRREARDA